jgi:hypothetical protein
VLALIILAALCLLFGLAALYFYLTQPPVLRGPDPRRPGYIRPSLSASDSKSHTTGPTPTPTGTSTGCKTDGRQRVERVELAMLPGLSKTGGRGYSGNVTALPRGGRMTGADSVEGSRILAARYEAWLHGAA